MASNNDHKQLALAAVMFFAPMVQSLLRDNKDLSEQEQGFVISYIQYGYGTIAVGILTIVLVIIYYFFPSTILYWIHSISIILTIGALVIGSIGAISGTQIRSSKSIQYQQAPDDKAAIILLFIPGYNIYQRYKEHNFTNPNIWIKESLLRWTVWTGITLMTQSSLASVCIALIILIRIGTLAGGIDIISDKTKNYSNKLFNVNPEELRSYIIASIDFISQKIQNKMIQPSREDLVHGYKKQYSYILNGSNTIKGQYAIGIVIIIISLLYADAQSWTRRLPVILVISRYGIMYYKWKHLPPLPLAREIQIFMQNLYEKIQKK